VGSPGDDAFLRQQAEEARAALSRAANDLKAAVAGTLDPRLIPRRYPFITVGAIAVTGFLAALVAIPSREQQELKRLERIRRAMYPQPEPTKPAQADGHAPSDAAAKPPLWVTLLREGVQAARPILISLVTASLKARQEATEYPSATGPSENKSDSEHV
jgi:hypothetical protein